MVGPNGRPVAGALAAGLRHDWFRDPPMPLKTDEFTALGLDPARPRLLCFIQHERKLAGSVVVRGDEEGREAAERTLQKLSGLRKSGADPTFWQTWVMNMKSKSNGGLY